MAGAATADKIMMSDFAATGLSGWEPVVFSGQTEYRLQADATPPAVRAISRASASGLVRKQVVDLKTRPWLQWSWRVDAAPRTGNELQKSGDDYAARVYVVVSGGLFFWRTRTLNYVWSRRQAPGSVWPSAFTSQAQLMALRRGDGDGVWYHERRNVYDDLKAVFGEAINEIHAVAIMTDSDNSADRAEAWYGDLWFSEH